MIDTVYKTVLTIMNKENQGYISPTEFNLIANNVQYEIYREYFEDENRDKNKENRGLTNKGYSNLAFNQRQRIDQFAAEEDLVVTDGTVTLPTDLYFIEDDGLTYTPQGKVGTLDPRVIEEVERNMFGYLRRSSAKPTEVYPVYERYANTVNILPETITQVNLKYLRKPKMPKWTFIVINETEIYDPSNASFQDFELHESEFSNIVIRIMGYFGINLREADVVQLVEAMKDKNNVKENN